MKRWMVSIFDLQDHKHVLLEIHREKMEDAIIKALLDEYGREEWILDLADLDWFEMLIKITEVLISIGAKEILELEQ